jgi:hypothetical protein
VGLANLGSESETCVGSRVHLVGVSISFEKNFYQLPFTPPLWFALSVLYFSLVARLEAIRILLAFSVAKGFKLHQMDVKSAFFNGVLEEEVYVRQPLGFESEKYPHRVYKLRKALYGLKQAPRAWYSRLRVFLFERGFEMGKVHQTLFLLRQGIDILIVQVYVDDIVFGGSSNSLVARFADDMSREFEISMMGELQFFLGL